VLVGPAVPGPDLPGLQRCAFLRLHRRGEGSRLAPVHPDAVGSVREADSATNVTNATNADKLDGKDASDFASAALVTRVSAKLSFGEDKVLLANGPVSLHAACIADDAGNSRIAIYAKTTEANSFVAGNDSFSGGTAPADFLQPDTPVTQSRVWTFSQSNTITAPSVGNSIDNGFVAAPSGALISGNGEEIVLGLRAFGADCVVHASLAVDRID
jgi:hypothetical protein